MNAILLVKHRVRHKAGVTIRDVDWTPVPGRLGALTNPTLSLVEPEQSPAEGVGLGLNPDSAQLSGPALWA